MAKELPYFKFEPSQWENGNIQVCSFEAQGIFMNVCAMYWQRLGELPYKLAVQKICNGNATALDSLCENEIIKLIDGMICIDFLNEQLLEFGNVSKVNSENARLGWEKRRKEAKAMRPHSERNAIREDKIREDKIREEESKTLDWFKNQIDGIYRNNLEITHKGKNIEQAILESYNHVSSDKLKLKNLDGAGAKKLVNTWLSNMKMIQQNGDKQTINLATNITAFKNRWADKVK